MRINTLDTQWGTEDLLMARGAGVDAILLPKVESAAMLQQAAVALAETDAPDTLKLWAMIETPLGILDVATIAREGSRNRLRRAHRRTQRHRACRRASNRDRTAPR